MGCSFKLKSASSRLQLVVFDIGYVMVSLSINESAAFNLQPKIVFYYFILILYTVDFNCNTNIIVVVTHEVIKIPLRKKVY